MLASFLARRSSMAQDNVAEVGDGMSLRHWRLLRIVSALTYIVNPMIDVIQAEAVMLLGGFAIWVAWILWFDE